MEKRTDLALEIRESFPKDEVEIEGVRVKEKDYGKGAFRLTKVEICNAYGEKRMGKPKGMYATMELHRFGKKEKEQCARILAKIVLELLEKNRKMEGSPCILFAGLGNRYATPDRLGSYVMERILVNRHLWKENEVEARGILKSCGVIPGVMAQTGMETKEILDGVCRNVMPSAVIVIDALASRSVRRLCRTIQITDTGIAPGSGIGNHRQAINAQTMKVPVIAIGVPTVVDASTIVSECMEDTLQAEGFDEREIAAFLRGISKKDMKELYVTPGDIDEQIRRIGDVIVDGINAFLAQEWKSS